ncbi:ASCH domain-containing protein [Hymenobacter antarcticus]|uniref:ASCH domain-containing protein n=1 Tax=Hymenobacter antarcticus TaxID=486270 RepID=A0ABP7QS71_9BACT
MILEFKPEFVPLIISGTKVHTIRAGRRWVAGHFTHPYKSLQP